MSTSTSCPIPGGRERLPDCYSTTPGGTLYATTPGGQRAGSESAECWKTSAHQDHLRPKVPAGVQELTHCPDTPLLPPSDSRGHNSSNSPTLQTGVAEGAEGDRGRDTR
ncbi:eukaryotic translation initiation factor 4E-binding protein 3 isoform X1 [Marmota monax]|uniref:eukaryotic translation initiation factor 4E-binding protein 3 isoform X1 n=1 Tax=Marmota monax TaxID=9995 RepID=UPI001EB05588|nr:eukaryotic translation initiation factor 4E-binding protein 3 isoform X1 [Marmota monax]XP_048667612.1 eukaryotic translation initiation factor 4E-binding protein 3 isoform X1 [Marmota marmota marmota]